MNWSSVMAVRLKQLRKAKGLSHDKLSSALTERYGISISRDSLMNYEVADGFHTRQGSNKGMRVEYLRYFSDFYNVSTDYLLGLTDTKATNEDVQAVCRVTGLREDNIYDLMGLNEPHEAPLLREMINEFLSFAVDVPPPDSLNERGITTYQAFRKYIDMANQRWKNLSNPINPEESARRAEETRQFEATANEHGYLIMSYNHAAEREWRKLQEEYGHFLLRRYRRFDQHGNPRESKEDANGND